MFEIESPTGQIARIPESYAEDQPYFQKMDADALRYLNDEGYVVLRRQLAAQQCRQLRDAFADEVKRFAGFLYRQTTAKAERNVFNANGHVMNPLLNPQDLNPDRFPRLRGQALDAYTSPLIVEALRSAFGENPKLVQSMYFEGNSATWAHQDTYYLDSERIGSMLAAWVALEDIHPGAGRFFVYPRSHTIDMAKNGGNFNIASSHDRYKALVIDIIRKNDLELRAPALGEGDVLLWKAKTIHGSLPTHRTERTRQSLTAHYIPESHRFLQLQSRIKPLALAEYNGISVHFPKDQSKISNRAALYVESHFPGPFYSVKKVAVRMVTRLSGSCANTVGI